MATRRSALSRIIAKRYFARLTRTPPLHNVYGFPLALGRALVLVHVVDDHELNGYGVVPLDGITAVSSESGRSFSERILRDRGTLAKVKPPRKVPELDSWRVCMRSLATTGQLITVHCDLLADEADHLFIGPIVGVSEEEVGILHFDPDAVWEKEPSTVKYGDITYVEFGDRYSSDYAEYLKPMPII